MIGDIELLREGFQPATVLRCDGSLVSAEDYPDLFAAIGTRYGGDDEEFALPSFARFDESHHFYVTAFELPLPEMEEQGAEPSDVARTLEEAKSQKFVAIDSRTDDICDLGFEFPPGSGQRFSLSLAAQAKLLGLDLLRDDSHLVYPVKYNTVDDEETLEIYDSETMHNFFLTAVGTYRAAIDSGTAVKDEVRAADTIEEADAVEDSR